MRNFRAIFIAIAIASSFSSSAQSEAVIREYIATYQHIAIAEMQRTGVPAAIKLAQGIHETMAGTSPLVLKSNNHFGIKCKSDWKGESVKHTDDAPNECFRKYSDPIASYSDHSNFLKNSPRYASLFKLDPLDYKEWAYGLKKAGYATNPKYPQVLIRIIEEYDLQQYSLIALGKAQPKEEMLANVTPDLQQNAVVAEKGPFIDNIVVNASVVKEEIKKQDEKVKEQVPVVAAAKKVETVDPAPLPVKKDYPSGLFKINDTKVVYVKQGTSFLAIAQQYNIPLAWLFDFNEMKQTETAEKDQLVYLQRKRKSSHNEFHIVRPGETLNDIASEEAIRIESLMEFNNLNRNSTLTPGQQLYLQPKMPGTQKLAIN
jgi:LysM repeat protein